MKASLRSLLADLIDYAGLFPPARLPMDQAIRNYARFRTAAQSWMLSRFVCPASRLAELRPFAQELFAGASAFRFSALARPAEDRGRFAAGLRADLEDVARFQELHGSRVLVDACEIRLPDDVLAAHDAAAVAELLDQAAELVDKTGHPSLAPFYEPGLTGDWRKSLAAVVEGLGLHNEKRRGGQAGRRAPAAGLKLRCGGLEAAAFPSSELVAFVLTACRDAGVPFKATAGLHHPIRRFDPQLRTHMHGFVNLFGSGVLAHAHRLNQERVRAVLKDERADDFVFREETFCWNDLEASTAQIETVRRTAMQSFGSCSFDEPRDGLRAMGLLGD